MSTSDDLIIRIPESFWTQSLKASGKGLFKATTNALKHVATTNALKHVVIGKREDLLTDVSNAAIRVTTPEERAGLLLLRSLQSALLDFTLDNASWIPSDDFNFNGSINSNINFNGDLNAEFKSDALLDSLLDDVLSEETVRLDHNFFDNPTEIAILPRIETLLSYWLIGHGMEEGRVSTAVKRLPSYFVSALHDEWKQHSNLYSDVLKASTGPFARADERERNWRRYHAYLQKQIDESLFDETFSLKQIYIPLRARYKIGSRQYQPNAPGNEAHYQVTTLQAYLDWWVTKDPVAPRHILKTHYQVIDLQAYLDSWVAKPDPGDPLRILSGGPGSGKSSFCKIYAAHIARERPDLRVLFVPLHRFDGTTDLKAAVAALIRQENLLMDNPLTDYPLTPSNPERHLLLIFDGIDGGSMQDRRGVNFIFSVLHKLVRPINCDHRIQALLSGRDLVFISTKLKTPGMILELLPYNVQKDDQIAYYDPDNLLPTDQRQNWWINYGTLVSQPYQGIPAELNKENLQPITANPLLNYLVALSFRRSTPDGRPTIDFSQDVNLNVIYRDLLTAVYDRNYAPNRRHANLQQIKPDDFIRVLEEIALYLWHGNARTTTFSSLYRYCKSANTATMIDIFRGSADSDVARLFTAFYFRQAEDTTNDGKSIGEYLIATRLVRTIKRIHKEITARQKDYYSGWDSNLALKHWVEICGPTPIDQDRYRFLLDEVCLQDATEVRQWQHTLAQLIQELQAGMPMHEFHDLSFRQMQIQARNAEESLLAAHSACAMKTKEVIKIYWGHKRGVYNWLHRLKSQSTSTANEQTQFFLPYLCLQGAELQGANLQNANLQGSDLEGANLQNANLREANLQNTNLEGAKLKGVDFQGADFQGANWWQANSASFEGPEGLKFWDYLEATFPIPSSA